jgi:hypothetical protein
MTATVPDRASDQALELRRELAALRDRLKDFDGDYDSTIELALHLRGRRAEARRLNRCGIGGLATRCEARAAAPFGGGGA